MATILMLLVLLSLILAYNSTVIVSGEPITAGRIATFVEPRGENNKFFVLGATALAFAAWAAWPEAIHLPLMAGCIGTLLLQFPLSRQRMLSVEAGGVVVDYLMWRRTVAFRDVSDVVLSTYKDDNDRISKSVVFKFGDGTGFLVDDLRVPDAAGVEDPSTIMTALHAAWCHGRTQPAPTVEPVPVARKAAYAAAVILSGLALFVFFSNFVLPPRSLESASLEYRQVVLRRALWPVYETEGDPLGSGIADGVMFVVEAADGRQFVVSHAKKGVDIAFVRALARNPVAPFTVVYEGKRGTAWWRMGRRTALLYGLERGNDVYIERGYTARELAGDRAWLCAYSLPPLVGLCGLIYGIFRPMQRRGSVAETA